MADVRVTVRTFPQEIAKVVNGPNGPVMRQLFRDGEKVKQEAKRLVGVYDPPDSYSAANRARRPGTLRDSIVKRFVRTSGGKLAVQVIAEDDIALIHHEGTKPHTIRPRSKPLLVFFFPKAGRVISTKQVSHPGTKPNRFLTNAVSRVFRSRL